MGWSWEVDPGTFFRNPARFFFSPGKLTNVFLNRLVGRCMSYFKIVPIFLGDKYVSFHGFIKGVFLLLQWTFPRSKSTNHWSSWHKMLVRCTPTLPGVYVVTNVSEKAQGSLNSKPIWEGSINTDVWSFWEGSASLSSILWVGNFSWPPKAMILYSCTTKGTHLELQTTSFLWLLQVDDFKSLKSLHKKWLFHQTSIKKWLFGVPGIYVIL